MQIKIFTCNCRNVWWKSRILIIDAKVNGEKVLIVNIYNSNTESGQIKTLDILKDLLEGIDNISDKTIILRGNLIWYFIAI